MTDPKQPLLFPLLIRFAKTGLMRFVGHLDFLALQQAMFLRGGFRVAQSEGPTHRLRMKTSPPTPVGVATQAEFTYLMLAEAVYPDEAARRLREQCGEGVEVLGVKDAGHLARKNPFGAIEAASYRVEFGEGVSDRQIGEIVAALERIGSEPRPEDVEEEEVKQFWGRILEIGTENGAVNLLALQREGETFHGARCAGFLEGRLGLPHYPVFTKLDYYRLKPSRRKLFS